MILWDFTNQYIGDDVQIFIHHPGGTTGVLDTAYLCIHNWLMVSNIFFMVNIALAPFIIIYP